MPVRAGQLIHPATFSSATIFTMGDSIEVKLVDAQRPHATVIDLEIIGNLVMLKDVGEAVSHPELLAVPESSIAVSVGGAGCPDDAASSLEP